MVTKNVLGLSPLVGYTIRVGHTGETPKTTRKLFWASNGFVENINCRETIGRLQTQNMGLATTDWRIINRRTESLEMTIVLLRDENMRKYIFNAFLGLSQLIFRLVQNLDIT